MDEELVAKHKIKLDNDTFYSVSDFAEMKGCSIRTAQAIYNAPEFPSEDYGKEKIALGSAIREWYSKKRSKYVQVD